MRGEENKGGVVNWLLFSLLRQNVQQKQLKEGKGHSGSQFEGYTVHHGGWRRGRAWQPEKEAAGHPAATVRKREASAVPLGFSF